MNPIQSTLKSKIEYSKISSLKNKTSSHVKYCAIYFLFLFIFLSLFVINYILTRKAFDKNKYILLLPEQLCEDTVINYARCLELKLTNEKCIIENQSVEGCYDETNAINRVCYIYLSELLLCSEGMNKTAAKQQCKSQINEVVQCASFFNNVQLTQAKILNYRYK